MKISPKYKVRKVADENIVLIQGSTPGDMTTVIALNETSLYLWNELSGHDFEIRDVVGLLEENYDVDGATALRDATEWVETLKKNNILL